MNKLKLILNTYFASYLNMKDTIKLVNKLIFWQSQLTVIISDMQMSL